MAWNDGYDAWKTSLPDTSYEDAKDKYIEEKSGDLEQFLQGFSGDLNLSEFIDWEKVNEFYANEYDEIVEDNKTEAAIERYEARMSRYDY